MARVMAMDEHAISNVLGRPLQSGAHSQVTKAPHSRNRTIGDLYIEIN
jgi:hypothetical protein